MADPLTPEEREALSRVVWGPRFSDDPIDDAVGLIRAALAAVPRLAAGAGEREALRADLDWTLGWLESRCTGTDDCTLDHDNMEAIRRRWFPATPPDGGTKPSDERSVEE